MHTSNEYLKEMFRNKKVSGNCLMVVFLEILLSCCRMTCVLQLLFWALKETFVHLDIDITE